MTALESLRKLAGTNTYAIAKAVSGKKPPDREYGAAQRRWWRLHKDGSLTLEWIEADLKKLGYRLKLEKIK